MKNILLLAILIFLIGMVVAMVMTLSIIPIPPPVILNQVAEASSEEILTHEQKVWMGALEWCESKGKKEAVNKIDRDGTPSYYSFQFKPSTLRYYGEKYGLIKKGKSDAEIMELLKNYDLQYAVVEHMIVDPGIAWEKQFPGCVRMLGRPPKITKN